MSAMPPPGAPQGADGPSEEEVRQYLAQMRGAPVDQVLVEVVQGLLNAAQIKLGRQDARLLIDVCAAMNDAARGRADDQFVGQVDQAVAQLRMAQVDAERETAGQAEPNDLPAAGQSTPPPADGDAAEPTASAAPPQQPPPQTSKLWIPGR